jgi:hypothetical protein
MVSVERAVKLAGGRRGGRRRSPGEVTRQVRAVRLSPEELADIEAAADRAGMAVSAWIGLTAWSAAVHGTEPVGQFDRELLAELIRVAGLVRRAGVNLDQATAKLNAAGTAGPELALAASRVARVAAHVDEAAELVRKRTRR